MGGPEGGPRGPTPRKNNLHGGKKWKKQGFKTNGGVVPFSVPDGGGGGGRTRKNVPSKGTREAEHKDHVGGVRSRKQNALFELSRGNGT